MTQTCDPLIISVFLKLMVHNHTLTHTRRPSDTLQNNTNRIACALANRNPLWERTIGAYSEERIKNLSASRHFPERERERATEGECMKEFQSFDPLLKHGLVAFAWNSIWHLTKVACYPTVCRWAFSNAEAALLLPLWTVIVIIFAQLNSYNFLSLWCKPTTLCLCEGFVANCIFFCNYEMNEIYGCG